MVFLDFCNINLIPQIVMPYLRPHWAKEMPSSVGKAPLVEYLQKAYAKDFAKVNEI